MPEEQIEERDVNDLHDRLHDDHIAHPNRHANKRIMAYIALISMVVVTLFLLTGMIKAELAQAISSILIMFYTAMVTIIVAYMGSSASTIFKSIGKVK